MQESSYTKHMAGHASNMMGGRIPAYNGCSSSDAAADRYHIFTDVDSLYPARRRHGMADDMKKTARLFRPASMSAAGDELAVDGMSSAAAGRYAGLFSPDSTPFGRGHKSAGVGGSLVDALNDAASPGGSGGNRSDCGDPVASSPLNGVGGGTAAGALAAGGGASLFAGSFGAAGGCYDVDEMGIYRRPMSRATDDAAAAAFRAPVPCYPFSQSYHHQTDSSFVLPHQQHQQQQQSGSIFYAGGHGTDAGADSAAGRDSSPSADGRATAARRYFSPAAGYFGAATPAPGGPVMPGAAYGGAESARYDGALGSLNSYLQRGGPFTSPGMASALHHLARSLPVFR